MYNDQGTLTVTGGSGATSDGAILTTVTVR
jgi:hypothetical protein